MIERLSGPSEVPAIRPAPAPLREAPISPYERDVFVRPVVQDVKDRQWQSLSTMFDQMMERHHRLMQTLKEHWQRVLPIQKETERREQVTLAHKAQDQRLNRR